MPVTPPPMPTRRRRRTPADILTALIRGIGDGCTIDELIAQPGATEQALMSLMERYRLRPDAEGVLAPPERDAREWALVLAEHSRSGKVRNRAARIRAAQVELDLQLERERVYHGTVRRVAIYRAREITALQMFRLTLRELAVEVDEEIARVRKAGDGELAAEAVEEINARPGRVVA